jgi:hypothetical protein
MVHVRRSRELAAEHLRDGSASANTLDDSACDRWRCAPDRGKTTTPSARKATYYRQNTPAIEPVTQ